MRGVHRPPAGRPVRRVARAVHAAAVPRRDPATGHAVAADPGRSAIALALARAGQALPRRLRRQAVRAAQWRPAGRRSSTAWKAPRCSSSASSGKAFFEQLIKDTQQGFFADPIYGGNRDMAAWKMIGFPGARYDYRDWVDAAQRSVPATRRSASAAPLAASWNDMTATQAACEGCRHRRTGLDRLDPRQRADRGGARGGRDRARPLARHRHRFPAILRARRAALPHPPRPVPAPGARPPSRSATPAIRPRCRSAPGARSCCPTAWAAAACTGTPKPGASCRPTSSFARI